MTETSNDQATMRREFADRGELIAYLSAEFPDAAARDAHISETRGGRAAAEALMRQIEPGAYGRTRNHLNGAVTRLSPYLRHGVVGLSEVRDRALARMSNAFDGQKLIQELGWRDYWQRLYAELGDGVWRDREPCKTGFDAASYAADLPPKIEAGETGLACIDGFAADLRETGYLHNHARMWTAAYVVHWRRVRWQAGARWFLRHLLDGDPASNNLSWQWVASTFSHKPYIFNRDNLERYTAGVYCARCPLASGGCPFDATYEELSLRLFPNLPPEQAESRNRGRRQGSAAQSYGKRRDGR